MRKTKIFSLLGIILLGGLIFFINMGSDENNNQTKEEQNPYQEEGVEVVRDTVEVVASDDGNINANNLFIPWTINKNENKFFLSQRDGTVIEIDGDLGLVEVQDVNVSKDILHEGEGGFLGFTLSPDFATTNRAYAYHTYEENGKTLNRIVSMTLNDTTWKEENVLLEEIPGGLKNTGGRIEIGPDGMLFATTGDTGQADLAQDLDNLAGKILRIDPAGEVPADNPFEDSYVFSYGHRNPQGFAWDDQGQLYSSEHGEDGHDEINLIEAGKNYGWPVIQGDEEAENMETPIVHSDEETWAPSGMAFSDGELYVASLAGSKIFTYDIQSETVGEFFGNAGRLRDVLIDGDALFTITNNHDDRGEPKEKDDKLINVPLTTKASSN